MEQNALERLARLEQDATSIHRRLDNLESLTESVHTIATEVRLMRTDISDANRDVLNISDRVAEIEKTPAKRYEMVITAVVTAIIGFIMGNITKFF